MLNFLKALKFGEELANPTAWKLGQLSVNAAVGLTLLAMGYFGAPVDMNGPVEQIVTGVVILLNLFITKASSKKI